MHIRETIYIDSAMYYSNIMPRRARKHQLGRALTYHIMNRGILGQDIFHDTQDVDSFIESVAVYIRRFEISVYHWCIMHNHYHLILKLNDYRILSKIAGGLQQIYARKYHKRYNTAGRFFQNRFKSQAIEQSSYLLACGRYVERNPVRAGLVAAPWEWPWSSARFYALGNEDPIITEDPELRGMGLAGPGGRMAYREWLMDDEKATSEEKYFRRNADVVGSDGFLRSMGRRGRRPCPRIGRPAQPVSK